MAKILLVEDDNNLREIYGERLLAEGYEIVAARDGEEALSVAITEKPDLIISDVMMPKISGFDMLDILRQTPETKDVKIIMMTALSQAEDKARADMLGANKYLVKSQVTLEDVARVVHDILEEPKPEQATEKPAEITNQTPTEPTNQPIVATPADDSASSQVQQSDDSTQTNNDDAVVTEDNTQITDTNANNTQATTADDQTQSANEVAPETATNNPEIQQPAQQESTQASAEQTEQPQIEQSQSPEADTPQPQIEQTEQHQDAPNSPEQNNQEEPQTSVEQSLATEPAQEALNQPTEYTQQTQAEQEPTVQQEQPQEANMQPQALPVNPIAQNIIEEPAQEAPQTAPEQPKSNSGDAEPAADELTEVTNQIEDFIKNSVTPLSEHQEPLTQSPTDINDTNKQQEQAQEPQPEQPAEPSTPENSVETIQNQEAPQADFTAPQNKDNLNPTPEVIDATMPYQNTNEPTAPNDPEAPQDNTIPPVIPVDSAEDSQNDETRNPEPASVRKKVISPMHGDGDLGTPDINKLYQEEMAKEAEENGLQNPVANSIVSASTNPISVGSGNAELPQLETIDASQIPGISTDGTAPIGVVTPTTTPEQPVQTDIAAQEPHEDPNNPNNIAL